MFRTGVLRQIVPLDLTKDLCRKRWEKIRLLYLLVVSKYAGTTVAPPWVLVHKDCIDCNNHRDIFFLSVVEKGLCHVEKVFSCASRVTLRLQRRPIYSGHDIFTTPAAGEVPRAAEATGHRLYWLDESLRPGQRKPLDIASIDLTKAFDLVSRSGLFRRRSDAPKTTPGDFPLRRHAQHSLFQRW